MPSVSALPLISMGIKMSFGQEAAQVSSGEIKAGKADKKLAIFLSLAHRQVYSNNFHLGESSRSLKQHPEQRGKVSEKADTKFSDLTEIHKLPPLPCIGRRAHAQAELSSASLTLAQFQC